MFFRFCSAIVLVVLVALAGTALEKRVLDLRRRLSRQEYRMDVLRERHARLRLETQQLGAPARMLPPATAAKPGRRTDGAAAGASQQ